MILVDTCIFRYLMEGNADAIAFFRAHGGHIKVAWVVLVELRRHVACGRISSSDFNNVLRFEPFIPLNFRQFILDTDDYLKGLSPGCKVLRIMDLLLFRCAVASGYRLATNDGDLLAVAKDFGVDTIACPWA